MHCEPFTVSVVLGDDLVTKLSICSIFDLKLKVLNILKNCDVPKVCTAFAVFFLLPLYCILSYYYGRSFIIDQFSNSFDIS